MDVLQIFLFILLGAVSCSHDWISGSVSVMTVSPGDNITLYCDYKTSSGVYIVWYRNCSHENQPRLVLELKLKPDTWKSSIDVLNPFPRFHFVRNQSSESYDMQIINITDSDEGLYYCGTMELKVESKEVITTQYVYQYSNTTTRIIFNSSEFHHHETQQDCGVCWTLLFSLCPAICVLSSLLSSLLVYHRCQKTAKELKANKERPDNRGQTREDKNEDVCYAALEVHQTSQTPKRTKTQSSATYSAINSCM
ncbi:uncharacterized protein LOC108896452 [Lates calcarifer]|uniref:Uncharacterized protein LOC108896452 n=1 Tax=Lates calcarifer TaxID=8187 RepID=A0AAJ7VFE5_LATCA|nr:uncharacterized protein LOC108896452 [Lates calcarifer]